MPLRSVGIRVIGLNHLRFKCICLYITVLEKIILPNKCVTDRTL